MKLLVYSDGSAASQQALHFGARLAQRLDADMAVITIRSGTHATEPPAPIGQEVNLADRGEHLPSGLQVLAHAMDVLCDEGLIRRDAAGTDRLRELTDGYLFTCQSVTGKRIPFYVCFGPMIDTLNNAIDRHRYDLLVIAPPRRGRLHQLVLGNTVRKLVLDLHASVLIVRGGHADSRYVVCADGSPASKRQSAMLKRIAPAIGPPVEVVWVRTPDSDAAAVEAAEHCLDRAARWMVESDTAFTIRRLEGSQPAREIVAAAGDDAVVLLSASLRHDVYRRLKGSLAIQILAHTTSSVLVVKGLPEDHVESSETP